MDARARVYETGSTVTLTAEPAPGWIFSDWTGDAGGSVLSVSVTMTANKNVQAIFTALLSLTATTAGGGTIALTPPGGPYVAGTIVQVAASADSGWQFLSWLGDLENASATNDVTMTRNKSVEGVFGTPLTVNVLGNGTVARQPNLPLFPAQSVVRLSAVPAAGSYFSFWSHPVNSIANPVDFQITGPCLRSSRFFPRSPRMSRRSRC